MNHNKELLEKIADEIFNEFQTAKMEAISKMLDNPGPTGIYPTTKCFVEIDAACYRFTTEVAKRYAEEMEKVSLERGFLAGKETEYFYDKSGVGTGRYPKWDNFEEWFLKMDA